MILQEKRAAEIYDKVWQRSLERLFTRFTDDRSEQATLSAGQSVIGYKRARNTAGPAHFEALIAAKPPATTTYLEAFDRATAKLYFQKAAQAADEAWQQTVVTNPTVSELEHPSSASQDDDDEDMDFSSAPRKNRLSALQLLAQHSPLSDKNRLRRLKKHSFPRAPGNK